MDYFYYQLIDAGHEEITWWAMTIRGIFFFLFGIALIKVGGKRMFSREGAFDIIISIVIGALLAKGIAGNGKVIPIIIATLSMAIFHNILSRLSFYNRLTEKFVKGEAEIIIESGKPINEAMKKYNITNHDIMEILRNKSHSNDIEDIKEAHVEANGKISLILKDKASKK